MNFKTPEKSFAAPPSSHLIRMTDKEFTTLVDFVKTKYGIDLSKKRVLIESRLAQELHKRKFTTFQQYIDCVFKDASGNEIVTMLNKLTTNLSYFMRENEHFNYMVKTILPNMEKKSTNRTMNIWSAGCSTGQEAYNIAMVLDEYFGSRKSLWNTSILATDISMRVLEKAQQGIYTADEIKNIPAGWKVKYFKALPDGNFQVCDKIRKEVTVRPGNLMEPFHFRKPFDLIFCRNVMIYFDMETKSKLVNKFYDWTAPGGHLFIGHSESINGTGAKYSYVQPAIYQKGV